MDVLKMRITAGSVERTVFLPREHFTHSNSIIKRLFPSITENYFGLILTNKEYLDHFLYLRNKRFNFLHGISHQHLNHPCYITAPSKIDFMKEVFGEDIVEYEEFSFEFEAICYVVWNSYSNAKNIFISVSSADGGGDFYA